MSLPDFWTINSVTRCFLCFQMFQTLFVFIVIPSWQRWSESNLTTLSTSLKPPLGRILRKTSTSAPARLTFNELDVNNQGYAHEQCVRNLSLATKIWATMKKSSEVRCFFALKGAPNHGKRYVLFLSFCLLAMWIRETWNCWWEATPGMTWTFLCRTNPPV